MSAGERDPLADLERHRVQLEENVSKLRKALRHWETWELEYETLKEEIQRFKGQPSAEDMVEVSKSLGGDLVNAKEMEELLGKDRQVKRTSTEVVSLISNRVDYVQRNIEAVQKQLTVAEKKLEAATVLLEPDLEDEEGLPLTDIQEELDDEGNVISSTLSHPSKTAPDLISTLEKAGITERENAKTLESTTSTMPTTSTQTKNFVPKSASSIQVEDTSKTTNQPSKKSVSFSQDTKENLTPAEASGLDSKGFNNDLAAFTFNKGQKVIEVDENDDEVASYPVVPANESPEDAALRRQMLAHGLSEVGSVVAEINLDEAGQEYSEDEDFDIEYDSDDDEDGEEEDQYGRATNKVLTDEYKQQMLELEKKWNARMVENLGPRPEKNSIGDYVEDLNRLVVQKGESQETPKAVTERAKPKKGVRFAENLDISSSRSANGNKNEAPQQSTTTRPTMSDTIVERKTTANAAPAKPSAPSKPAQVSRFKGARAETGPSSQLAHQPVQQPAQPYFISGPRPRSVPEGPPGKTLASSVIERTVDEANVAPPDQDDLDPDTVAQEVAVQYNKVRNRMIHEQGGFLPSKEEANDPLIEERDGKAKKVSRFKAARLNNSSS